MNLGRSIGVMLAVVAFAAGCTSTGSPGRTSAPAAPVTVHPSQIFADVPQSP